MATTGRRARRFATLASTAMILLTGASSASAAPKLTCKNSESIWNVHNHPRLKRIAFTPGAWCSELPGNRIVVAVTPQFGSAWWQICKLVQVPYAPGTWTISVGRVHEGRWGAA